MDNTYIINSIWVLAASVFVFFMQAGFACCESGFARSKNACNIWLKNLVDFCVGALAYYFIGFGLMYGDDWCGIIGINGFINPLDQDLQIWQSLDGSLSPHIYLLFQTMFCATTATIISGTVAERFKFNSYIIVSVCMTAFIYPVIGHWVWGGGWLSSMGFADFAGSGTVHAVGGTAALIGAKMVGPRIGKYVDGKVNAFPGHNIPMGILGAMILWVGWYGFNPGSELAFDETTVYTTITTTYAGAAGGIAGLFFSWIKYKKPDPTLAANGALGGLVASCTAVAQATPCGMIIIGLIAGIVITLSIEKMDHVFHIDDPVGAVSLHGVCGTLGCILAGFFSEEDGLFYGFDAERLLHQLIGMAAIIAFVVVFAGLMFFILKKTIGIRVSREEELEGLDIHEHGMEAYADDVAA